MTENLLCLGFISLYSLNCVWFCCVIFKSEWYLRAAFWVFLHAMFMFDWIQPAQRQKLREGLLTINKINIIRWNMYRDNNFHSRRQVLRVKCLWKSWVRWAYELIYVLSRLPRVCSFSRWTRGKKIAQSFLITKYSSEPFLWICGQKMSKGFLNLILL